MRIFGLCDIIIKNNVNGGYIVIKVILWDIDNTLLDFDEAEVAALNKGFEEFELGEFTEEMLKEYMVINRRRWQMLERGEMPKKEVVEGRFIEFFEGRGLPVEKAVPFNNRYQELLGEVVYFRDNAYEIIKDLKGKVLQCAASNGTKVAQVGKLKNSGLGELFDLVFISEDVGYEKPAIEFFDKALGDSIALLREKGDLGAEEELNLSDVLMIGDSLTSDMKGGNNAGIKTCWYNPKGHVNDKGVQVDYEIKELSEVYGILGEMK